MTWTRRSLPLGAERRFAFRPLASEPIPMISRNSHWIGAVLIAAALPAAPVAQAARVPMFFNGTWQADLKYRKGDVVVYNNALYQSAKRNAGSKPDAGDGKWLLLVQSSGSGGTNAPAGQDCGKPTVGGNLAGCDLKGASASLKDLKLSGINLTGASLDGDIGNVDLTGASLRGALLGASYANGSLASLTLGSKAVVNFADLTGASSGSGNTPLIANGASFKGASLASASLASAQLQGSDLSQAALDSIDLSGASLAGATAVGARIGNGTLYAADLANANLEGANLWRANLETAKLVAASLYGADLRGANLGGTDLTGAYLGYANLLGAVNGETAILGTDPATGQATEFEGAVCPDGALVDGIAVTTCLGHGIGP